MYASGTCKELFAGATKPEHGHPAYGVSVSSFQHQTGARSPAISFPCGHVHWLCNSFFVMHVTRSLAILLRGAGRRFAWRSCECWRPLRILGSQRSLEAKHPRAPREALLLQGALCLWLRRGVLRRPERAAQAHTHSGDARSGGRSAPLKLRTCDSRAGAKALRLSASKVCWGYAAFHLVGRAGFNYILA